MDRRSIIIAVSVIVAIHAFLVLLLVLPGCNSDRDTSRISPQTRSDSLSAPVEDSLDDEPGQPLVPTAGPEKKSVAAELYQPSSYRALRDAGAKHGLGAIPKRPKLSKQSVQKVTGILIDLDTRQVLWEHHSSKEVAIASLTKLMTLLLAYETTLTPGSGFTAETPIQITPEARRVPPSGVAFKPAEKSFPLEKLMIASAVRSANDAAYLIAQTLGGGSADGFIQRMNQKAKTLGMTHTTFYNPHGLPGQAEKKPDNTSTVKDIARLCEAYIYYPQLRKWSGSTTGTFRTKNDLSSHNHLLPGKRTPCNGVCGLKTGFTNNAGFCVAALCKREGRTLLAVVTGFSSRKERDEYVRSLLNWGYSR